MAKAKPRKGLDDWLPFSFRPESRTKLAALGLTNPIIEELEDDVEVFIIIRNTYHRDARPSEVKAALEALGKSAKVTIKAAEEVLDLGPILFVHELNNGSWLPNLTRSLKYLKKHTEEMVAMVRVKQGNTAYDCRSFLATSVTRHLKNLDINPTTYEMGPFYQCLKICLQAAGEVEPDDDYNMTSPNIKDLVSRTVKALRNRV